VVEPSPLKMVPALSLRERHPQLLSRDSGYDDPMGAVSLLGRSLRADELIEATRLTT